VRSLIVGLLLVGAPALAAQLTVGPYVQDVRPDGFTVVFETDAPAEGRVTAGDRAATTQGTHHEARLDGLAPATRHAYQVLVDGWSAGGAEVTTAPAATEPALTFVAYGDTREGGDIESRAARVMAAESPDLALHTGDLVRTGDNEADWARFFAREAPLLERVPLYPAVGNHELYRDPSGERFRRFFVLPADGRTRRYYSFRWGPARFIALDGNAVTPEQTGWLQQTLAAARAERVPHVFVYLHQPPFSTGGHCGAAIAEADWVHLFERYDVRAVFGGHDHSYQRLERGGVTYFVTGGGGAQIYAERADCAAFDLAARRRYVEAFHYLRVSVVGEVAEVAALTLDGAEIESVRLRARTRAVATHEPPLEADRVTVSWASIELGTRVSLAAGGVALLLLARRLLRRRRLR
jgi:hypothetical protein